MLQGVAVPANITSAVELLQLVGKEFGPSDWHVLSSPEIRAFLEVTHNDEPDQSDQGDAYKTAPGYIVLALWPRLVGELLALRGSQGFGVEELKDVSFIANLPVEARLRVRLTVMTAEPVMGGIRYEFRVAFEMEGQVEPVASAVAVCHAALP